MAVELGYAFAVILASIGAIAYVFGRSDVAWSSWMWALIVAAVASLAAGGLPGGGGEGVVAELQCPPGRVFVAVPIYLVGPQGSVDWGDGSSGVMVCSGAGYCSAMHVYTKPGVYKIRAGGGVCNVTVVSFADTLRTAFTGNCSLLTSPVGCIMAGVGGVAGEILGRLTDAIAWALSASGGGSLIASVGVMLVTVPEDPRYR